MSISSTILRQYRMGMTAKEIALVNNKNKDFVLSEIKKAGVVTDDSRKRITLNEIKRMKPLKKGDRVLLGVRYRDDVIRKIEGTVVKVYKYIVLFKLDNGIYTTISWASMYEESGEVVLKKEWIK